METTLAESDSHEKADADEPPLEQRLWNVAQATEDGRVRGHIDACELADDDTIRICVRLPNAETHTQTFAFPKADSPEYAFVRLVEDCGYSLAAAAHLASDDGADGARVWCEPAHDPDSAFASGTEPEIQGGDYEDDGDDWRLVVPEYTPPLRERLRARLGTLDSWQVISTLAVGGGLLLLPLIFPIILFRVATDDNPPDTAMTFVVGVTALFIWSAVMWVLYTAVLAPGV